MTTGNHIEETRAELQHRLIKIQSLIENFEAVFGATVAVRVAGTVGFDENAQAMVARFAPGEVIRDGKDLRRSAAAPLREDAPAGLNAAIRIAAVRVGKSFNVAQIKTFVAAEWPGKFDQKQLNQVSWNLHLMAEKGELVESGKGKERTFSVAGKVSGRTPSPRPSPPGEGEAVSSRSAAKPRVDFRNHARAGKMIVSMRLTAADLKTFTREQLTEWIRQRCPEFDAKQLYQIGSNLILMLERGELTRKGVGTAAVWTVGKLKGAEPVNSVHRTVNTENRPVKTEAADREKEWQKLRGDIQVPRDPDVEKD